MPASMQTAGIGGAGVQAQAPMLILAEHDGAVERELIARWLESHASEPSARQAIFHAPANGTGKSDELARALASFGELDGETELAPVRVAWLPPRQDGERRVRWRDLLRVSDPRHPSEAAKRRLAQEPQDRWRIVEAEPATVTELRDRWQRNAAVAATGDPAQFARFVARQAELALERAEVRLRGRRYKVPRVIREDVTGTPAYQVKIARLAAELGRDEAGLRTEIDGYLHELRTAHDAFVFDLTMRLFHWIYSRGYGEVDVIPDEIERLRALFAAGPVALLPSHKTNMDGPILESVLALNDLPPPLLFGGINMAFWPVGPLMRRTGRVFLRRGIGDNRPYKFALREWLSHLMEKRFNLEWFPEGTRSRTGKLLPHKLGLYSYAAEAYRQGKVDDLTLVPIAIVYDQAYEVAEFSREAQGGAKKAENFGWMLKTMRETGEPQGKAYLRIGEPLSMRAALGPPDPAADRAGDADSPEARLALQKLAFAVAWQTNRVTPITGIALVAFALLAAGDRAVTIEQIMTYTDLLCRHARERGQPLTASGGLDSPEQVREVLRELVRTKVVLCYDKGTQPVYAIAPGRHVAAAFYRNTMLHFVLERAIAELAVLAAAEKPAGEREAEFWEAALRLREGHKFEFFFRERPLFEQELESELTRIHEGWRELLDGRGEPLDIHRAIFGIGIAHAVLRPFVEAQHVMAQALLTELPGADLDQRAFVAKCQRLGRQYLLQKELKSAEAVSKPLFETTVKLARNVKLIGPGLETAERRAWFAERVAAILRRIDAVESRATADK